MMDLTRSSDRSSQHHERAGSRLVARDRGVLHPGAVHRLEQVVLRSHGGVHAGLVEPAGHDARGAGGGSGGDAGGQRRVGRESQRQGGHERGGAEGIQSTSSKNRVGVPALDDAFVRRVASREASKVKGHRSGGPRNTDPCSRAGQISEAMSEQSRRQWFRQHDADARGLRRTAGFRARNTALGDVAFRRLRAYPEKTVPRAICATARRARAAARRTARSPARSTR